MDDKSTLPSDAADEVFLTGRELATQRRVA